MPSLTEDFMNPAYWGALGTSIVHGLKVLAVLGVSGALLTFISGGSQARHWVKSDEAH